MQSDTALGSTLNRKRAYGADADGREPEEEELVDAGENDGPDEAEHP